MRVTRGDVARRAGVSPALVSYVLNGGPRPVSAAARERIVRAIEELGYRPDAVAQAMRGSPTRTIGLMTSSPTNPFFAELAEAVEERLFRADRLLAIAVTDDDPARERRYLQTFADRRFDGILLISSSFIENLSSLGAQLIPVVVLDRVTDSTRAATSAVHIDNLKGAGDAVAHLQEHGHTAVACIAGPADVPSASERVAGWRTQLRATGVDPDPDLLEHVPFGAHAGYKAMTRLMSRRGPQRPTAIFVSSDVQALGALHACAAMGLSVPRDVALVSFDGTVLGSLAVPSLSSIVQPLDRIADVAITELLDRIADPSRAPSDHVLEGRLRTGSSCGCAWSEPAVAPAP